jgi:hypothetical protein
MRHSSLLIAFIFFAAAVSIAQQSSTGNKDKLVIPAGTQIKVDLWNRNVAGPYRMASPS